MGFLAVGINHTTAPVALREQVAFAPEVLAEALQDARIRAEVDEVAILSTCNRTELYAFGAHGGDLLLGWLEQFHGLAPGALTPHSYLLHGQAAVRHMMRVACGLDSLVLGEPQILGQMKNACAVAREADVIGPMLERLFQNSFTVAKSVRTQTAIGENPVSVAYAAVTLARQIFADLNRCSALLIGAGETIELVARHLKEQGVSRLTVANRTLERARQLAEQADARAVMLADIPAALVEADIVISSTASQLPILGKGTVERALKQRRHRPIFMVDIAVPRDIEPEVGDLADIYLYGVDDLREVVEDNRRGREAAAEQAEALVSAGVEQFQQRLRALDAVEVIRAYRARMDALREQELARVLAALERGEPAEQLLRQLARNLTNKMMHTPSVQLRQAGASGASEQLEWARELLGLDTGK